MTKQLVLALAAGLLLVAAAAGATVLLAGGGSGTAAAPQPATDPHGKAVPALRTVHVLPKGAAPVAGSRQGVGGVELVRRVSGPVPAGVVEATVLTDENCAPDMAGVSHCRNDLKLPSGQTLAVVHDHPMATIACLAPGERVRVRAA